MPIERKPYPYELLRRYNKDGTLRGAHFKALICMEEDGVTIDEKEGDAQPVAAGITALGLDLATLLGQETAALQLTVEQHEATIAAHAAELIAKDANIQELLEANARLQTVVDAFAAETEPSLTPENPGPGSAAEPSLEA